MGNGYCHARGIAWRYMLLDGVGRYLYTEAKGALFRHQDCFPLVVSPPVMNTVFLSVLDDCPHLFWFEGLWDVIEREGRAMVRPKYNCNKRTSLLRAAELDAVRFELEPNFKGRDNLQVALGLYDWMIKNVRYGASGSDGQTAYDALVRRTALCKGISKGYQLLLFHFGISSTLARGSIEGAGRHVWNLVPIGERFLHVDVTLAHRQFDHLFGREEWGDSRRCFLMDDDVVRSHGVMVDEDVRHVCV